MKTRIVILGFLALTSILSSCNKDQLGITPSQNVTTIEKSIAGNSKLDVSSQFRVHITFADGAEKVTIEANENLQQYIKVEDKNGWLKIKFKTNINVIGNDAVLNIYISTKNIKEYQIDGAASVFLENDLYADEINIELDGAAHFSGSLHSNKLYANLSGSSEVDVNGYSTYLNVIANGGSRIKNYDLESVQLDVDLNGASEAFLTVSGTLSVKANGASAVFYKGNGRVYSQDLNGGSRIIKLD